jgi:hypothetical protein
MISCTYVLQAYFEPNKTRPNLHVLLNALVTKIEIVDEAGEDGLLIATGVNIIHSDPNDAPDSGKSYSFKAEREVILCTGCVMFYVFSACHLHARYAQWFEDAATPRAFGHWQSYRSAICRNPRSDRASRRG